MIPKEGKDIEPTFGIYVFSKVAAAGKVLTSAQDRTELDTRGAIWTKQSTLSAGRHEIVHSAELGYMGLPCSGECRLPVTYCLLRERRSLSTGVTL